jgi:hypothetical protein
MNERLACAGAGRRDPLGCRAVDSFIRYLAQICFDEHAKNSERAASRRPKSLEKH